MSTTPDFPLLAARISEVVREAILEIRPRLVNAALTGNRGESENHRHEDNFLSVYDMWMHDRYRQSIAQHLQSFVYASEEDEPRIVGPDTDPDLCVLVDPLDTSELAVRALHGYTHVMVYSRALARPVISVIGDIYHHVQLYVAVRDNDGTDRAYIVTADGQEHPLLPATPKPLSRSIVTNFLMRPSERFVPLSLQDGLISALERPDNDGKHRGRIGVDFGSVSLCHVAAGFTEAVLEFAKGFAIWDLAPGHFVLEAVGGTVIDLNGHAVSLNYGLDSLTEISKAMNPRQKFIAAGSHELAQEILQALHV